VLDFSAAAYGKAATTTVVRPTVQAPQARPLSPEFNGVHPVHTPAAVRVTMASTDLLDAPMDWSWEQLRDYVMRSILERHGPQPRREAHQINSIFKSFAARWGNQAGPIARFAFEQQDGYWRSAPVDIRRFTKGNDDYFAGPISERLADA
jgi:hypothetical protein